MELELLAQRIEASDPLTVALVLTMVICVMMVFFLIATKGAFARYDRNR